MKRKQNNKQKKQNKTQNTESAKKKSIKQTHEHNMKKAERAR